MEPLVLIIFGDPATKKNSQRLIYKNGRRIIVPSKRYYSYKKSAIEQIGEWVFKPIDYPVSVKALFYMQTRRKVDITNLLEALHDILQDAGIIADDCRDIIASVDGSRVSYDKEHPRVEIYIKPLEESYEKFAKEKKHA